MERILYYALIFPISLLPLKVSYYISDFLFVILYHLAGYRKGVVIDNITNSFPEKSEEEVKAICKEFYSHFCDLMIESFALFRMSKEELVSRCKVTDLGELQRFYDEGRTVIIPAGHYANWELAAAASNLQIPHLSVGIYKPLSAKYIDAKLQTSRARFGLKLVSKKQIDQFFHDYKDRPTAVLLGADQAPRERPNLYWTEFLNQETAVMYGTEKYAKKYDYPVVFGRVRKLRRGYYTFEFSTIEEFPNDTPHNDITERHTRFLEQMIEEDPAYWLWTHKRWKRKRPVGGIDS